MLEWVGDLQYQDYVIDDWRTSRDEGRDVAALEKEAHRIFELPRGGAERLAQAEKLYQQLQSAPFVADWPYDEPSELAAIQGARPAKRFARRCDDKRDWSDAVRGAWHGRIAGCLAGKATEGLKRAEIAYVAEHGGDPTGTYLTSAGMNEELAKKHAADKPWIDEVGDAAPPDDDTNYTVLALRVLETYGRDFRPADVGEMWLWELPMLSTWTAERVAYRNMAMALMPPETATSRNPFREYIGAQIRGDLYGMVNPGDPETAAAMAWRDASISHTRNGIYGEMWVAAMIAAAPYCRNFREVVEAGLGEIPERSRLAEAVRKVIRWQESGLTVEQALAEFDKLYDEHDHYQWVHVLSNAMLVAMALLYHGEHFGDAVRFAVFAGFDTDCNGATAGAIIGMQGGASAVPDAWVRPLNGALLTTLAKEPRVTIDELTARTLAQMPKD